MPYAEHRETAQRWATERAIACWAWFCGDLSDEALALLQVAAAESRVDGATWVLVVRPEDTPTAREHDLADEIVVGAAAPEPWGLFAALQAAGASDVQRLGVVGASRAALEAGRRTGAGTVIALAANNAARTTFRVCALGALTVEALEGFSAALERALAVQPTTAAV